MYIFAVPQKQRLYERISWCCQYQATCFFVSICISLYFAVFTIALMSFVVHQSSLSIFFVINWHWHWGNTITAILKKNGQINQTYSFIVTTTLTQTIINYMQTLWNIYYIVVTFIHCTKSAILNKWATAARLQAPNYQPTQLICVPLWQHQP